MPTTSRPVLAETGRRPRRRRWPLLVLSLLLVLGYAGWVAARSLFAEVVPASCTATADGRSTTLAPDQAANAATIAAVSVNRGMPARAATIAIATAIQESKLRNLTVGDRDSVGLFQQRPSQGWGTVEQILDPVYATNAFYDRLARVSDYTDRPLTEVAQQVQRSAYPDAYADHEEEARVLASVLTGQSPAGLVCTLRPAEGSGSPSAVAAALERQLGTPAAVGAGGAVSVQAAGARAWAAGAWAVAHADGRDLVAVQVGDRAWQRDDGDTWRDSGRSAGVRISVAGSR